MRLLGKLLVLLVMVSVVSPVLADKKKDPKMKAIEARKAEMTLRSFNAGPLFAMAKGKMPYDAKKAQMHADNLKRLLEVNMGAAWMPGTSIKEYGDDTTALPKIWDTWPEISDYGKDYAKAVNELAEVAGDGQDALGKGVKALGKACKGCHDEFREKD